MPTSFPSPYPTGNPYVGSASEAASGAASIYNGLQNRLASAANQQATANRLQANTQAAQDHQDQQDYFKAIQDGWVPAQAETRLPSGMIDRTQPARQGMDPSRTATIGRKQMYKPTDQETGKTFVPTGQLADALTTAGWDGKTPLSAEQSHGIMQALNEAQPKDEAYEYDASGKYIDARTGVAVPGLIGKKSKKFYPIDMSGGAKGQQQEPQTAPGGGAPGGAFDLSDDPGQPGQPGAAQPGAGAAQGGSAFSFAPPEKAEKADSRVVVPGMQGPNGGMLVHDKTSNTIEEVPYPKGSKPVLNAVQTEADKDRHVRQSELEDAAATRKTEVDRRASDAQAKVEEQFARNHEAAGIKKESMQSMAQGYWDAAKTEPESTYFPPRLVNGIVVPGPATRMPSKGPDYDARQQDLAKTAKGFEKTAATHQTEQERIEKQRGWGKFAPPAQTTAPVVPATASPVISPVTRPVQKPVQPTAAPAAKAANPYIVGRSYRGMKYLGGDPKNQASWGQ